MSYLPDPFDEIRQLEAIRQRRQRVSEQVQVHWTPGRAYELAKLARNPIIAPGVALALARAGFTAEDPISQYAAMEAALQRSDQRGGYIPPGSSVQPHQLRSPTLQERFNIELKAGWALGLINDEGILEEPYEEVEGERRGGNVYSDPFARQFQRIMEAAQAAGIDVPYVNYEGRPTVVEHAELSVSEEAMEVAERRAQTQLARGQGPEGATGIRERVATAMPTGRIRHLDEEEDTEGGRGGGPYSSLGRGLVTKLPGGEQLAKAQTAGVGGPAGRRAMDTVKELSQGVFMALDAPVQELQGQFRNIIGATQGRSIDWTESQSDMGITLGRSLRGERPLEAGGGFFVDPRSELGQERLRRERERGTIGGQVITLGRWVGSRVVEPGSKPYQLLSGLVDAGVQIYGDPAVIGLKSGRRALEASRTFAGLSDEALEAAGGIKGLRRVVHPPTAEAWLNGRQGTRVIQDLANETNVNRVYKYLNRKVDPRLAAQIADTSDPGDVANLLRDQLGVTIRRTSELPHTLGQRIGEKLDRYTMGATGAVPASAIEVERRQTPALRQLVNRMPARRIDTEDPHSAMAEMDAWMRNARMDESTIDNFLDRLARQETRQGIFDVVQDVMTTTNGVLKNHGVHNGAVRSRLTKMFKDSYEDTRHYLVSDIGDDIDVWDNVVVGGEARPRMRAHLLAEHYDRYLPLPADARAVRRLTSKYKNILAKGTFGFEKVEAGQVGQLRLPLATAAWLQDEVWKPMTLLRGAWTVRVVGEEQVRMAASGYDSTFRHPLSFIAWRIGKKGDLDAAGSALKETDEHNRAMARLRGAWLSERPSGARHAIPTIYRKTDQEMDDFLDGWSGELALLHSDPVAKEVARFDNLDEATEWFTTGAGQKFRKELQEAHPELADRNVARNYLESVQTRIGWKTGGNPDLTEIVKTGKLRGNPILESDGMRHRDLSRELSGYLDSAPDVVKGRAVIHADPDEASRIKQSWDRITDTLFGALMTKRTNNLSRSPVFRQSYWRRVEELIPHTDEATKTRLIAGAEGAGIGSRARRRMSRQAPAGELSFDEIDVVAKGHALGETKRLLYDLTERSQFFDGMRLIFPFGEAWKEMIGRWGQIMRQNPAVPRRAQQVIEGARGEDLGEFMGAPEGQGFFYTNQFGEEVFVYPFTEAITRNTVGVPIPLVGRVQGLNLMGSVVPGLGPVAQLPANAFFPDKPGWQRTARELFMPFGVPSDEGGMEAWTQQLNFAPAWFKRGWQALTGDGYSAETDRIYTATTMDVARYLESTGRYDLSTREGVQELIEDAKERATKLYGIRAIAQFFAPSAPSPEFMVETDQGMRRVAALAEEFHRITQDNPDTGVEEFLGRYGDDVTLVTTPKTRTLVAGLEPSQQVEDWMRANKDVVRKFPNTWAFFAPTGGDFEYAVYRAQINRGERQPLTMDQWVRSRNNTLGQMIYRKARRQAGPRPSDEVEAWLRTVKGRIRENYPGYEDPTGLAEKTPTDVLIRELENAANSPVLADTEAGEGLQIYFRARDKAIGEARARGLVSHTRAQSALDLRDWLRTVASRIIRKRPSFEPLWFYLEREMAEDFEVAA